MRVLDAIGTAIQQEVDDAIDDDAADGVPPDAHRQRLLGPPPHMVSAALVQTQDLEQLFGELLVVAIREDAEHLVIAIAVPAVLEGAVEVAQRSSPEGVRRRQRLRQVDGGAGDRVEEGGPAGVDLGDAEEVEVGGGEDEVGGGVADALDDAAGEVHEEDVDGGEHVEVEHAAGEERAAVARGVRGDERRVGGERPPRPAHAAEAAHVLGPQPQQHSNSTSAGSAAPPPSPPPAAEGEAVVPASPLTLAHWLRDAIADKHTPNQQDTLLPRAHKYL